MRKKGVIIAGVFFSCLLPISPELLHAARKHARAHTLELPRVLRVQNTACPRQVHDKHLLKKAVKERPGPRCGCRRAEFPTHFLKPLGGGAWRVRTRPCCWVHWMTGCVLSLTQGQRQARCSQEPLPLSRVSSRSALAAATICHFPLPQGLRTVPCPAASALTHTHAPPRPPAPLFGKASNKEALFFSEDKNAESQPGSPSASPGNRWLSTRDRAGTGPALCSAGYPVAPPLSPHFIHENTEVQRKEGLVCRDWGCGWGGVPAAFPGAHKVLPEKVLSLSLASSTALVQPPALLLFWSPPGSSSLSAFALTVPCAQSALSHMDDACGCMPCKALLEPPHQNESSSHHAA